MSVAAGEGESPSNAKKKLKAISANAKKRIR
jgi:hypothetical protein